MTKLNSFIHVKALIVLMIISIMSADAIAAAVPQGFNLQGRLVRPDGSAVEASSVDFLLQIRSPGSESCILFEEMHTLNMATSDGLFSIKLGTGLRSGTNFKDTSTLTQAFDNSASAIASLNCASGTSFDPSSGDVRKLRISFDEGSGTQTLAQDQTIGSVPYALYADSLQGKSKSDFLQTVPAVEATPGTSQSRINRLIDTDWTGLDALLQGTSNLYAKAAPTAAVSNNNQRLINVADPTGAQDAATKNYSDTMIGGNTATIGVLAPADAGKAITWDGTKWVASTLSTTDNTKVAKTGDTMTGALNLPANGLVAGTTQLVLNSGNVGIGIALPTAPLHVVGTTTATGGSLFGSFVDYTVAPTAAANANYWAHKTQMSYTGTGTATGIIVAGEYFAARSGAGAGDATTITGLVGTSRNSVAGTLTNSTAIHGYARNTAGTTSTAIGGRFEVLTSAGTTGVGRGVYIGNVEATTKHSLYAADATAPSYFAGSVGIGNASPAHKLDVTGSINATTSVISTQFQSVAGTAASVPFTSYLSTGGAESKYWDFYQDGTNFNVRALNDAYTVSSTAINMKRSGGTVSSVNFPTGNVGIGTSSPSTKVHIFSAAPEMRLQDSAYTASNNDVQVAVRGTDSAGTTMWLFGDSSNATNDFNIQVREGIRFITDWSNNTTANMMIRKTGEVGIGVLTPTAALQLKAGTATAGTAPLKLTAGTNLTTPEAGAIEFDGVNLYYTNASNARQTIATGANGGGDFKKDGTVAMTGSITLAAGEQIQNTTDTVTLNGTSSVSFNLGGANPVLSSSASLEVNTNATVRNGKTLSYSDIGNDRSASLVMSDDAEFKISTTAGHIAMMPTLNVGIGTTTPTAKLHVAGPMRMTASALPGSPNTGDLAIDSGDGNKLKWYNGTGWQSATGVAIGQVAGTAMGADAVQNCTSAQKLQMSLGPTFAWSCVSESGLAKAGDQMTGTLLMKSSTANGTATVSFSTGNLQHTTADCGAFALHNMQDGGSYSFAVKGTNSTTCSFTAFSDAGSTALTVHMPPDHAATIATKHTLYSFLVMGADVYVTWMPGM